MLEGTKMLVNRDVRSDAPAFPIFAQYTRNRIRSARCFRVLPVRMLKLPSWILSTFLRCLFSVAWLSSSICAAYADSVTYAYDELGRVVQATDATTGKSITYTYDAAGNIGAQTALSLTTLAIAGFAPARGSSGTQVAISGTGFSTTLNSNTVKFNGVAGSRCCGDCNCIDGHRAGSGYDRPYQRDRRRGY